MSTRWVLVILMVPLIGGLVGVTFYVVRGDAPKAEIIADQWWRSLDPHNGNSEADLEGIGVTPPVSEEESVARTGIFLSPVVVLDEHEAARAAESIPTPPSIVRPTPPRDGPWTTYHPNGQIEEHGMMKAARREGTWIESSPDGVKILETEYRAGLASGPLNAWYDDGRRKCQAQCEFGELVGQCSFWREDGVLDLVKTGFYENGVRIRP